MKKKTYSDDAAGKSVDAQPSNTLKNMTFA